MKQVVDVLVGGQYGSEAKGLIGSLIPLENKYDFLVSVNSAQAGHTGYHIKSGKYFVTRHLPCACINDEQATIFVGAGAIINLQVLEDEIKHFEANNIPVLGRLIISSEATVITDADVYDEKEEKLGDRIGSTCEGVGMALSKRIRRQTKAFKDYYKDFLALNKWGTEDIKMCNLPLSGHIFLEGSQGFALSLFSGHYPFCTSRDTTSSAFLSYARLSPRAVRDIYGVYRTFPIRVGGNSGDIKNEVTWEDVADISGYDNLAEFTTVTKRMRRVAMWDSKLARESMVVNGVNKPIVTFLNYLDSKVEGKAELTPKIKEWLQSTEKATGVVWHGYSTGKNNYFKR